MVSFASALARPGTPRPIAGWPLAVPGVSPSGGRLNVVELSSRSVEELMEAYVSGSAPAFDELYARVAPKLFGYLLRLTRNRARAEDLLQVTFAKIHRARGSYLRGAPFLPWASAIARRSFFDEVRAARARKEDLSLDGRLPEAAAPADTGGEDLREVLERALDALPETYREAIHLTKLTGLSLEEAATVLGTTATAVKLRVHRGYLALREALAPVAGAVGRRTIDE